MRLLVFVTVCLLVSVLADDTPLDLTLQAGAKGREVVDACIGRIDLSQIFSDDAGMLKRIAWVESQFGEADDAPACIWGVTPTMFEGVVASQPVKDAILAQFGLDWDQVDVSDLDKPLYCALAARLLLVSCLPNLPLSLTDQADLWATCYRNNQGDMQSFINATNVLEQESECKIPGMDMVFVLDGSGSVGSDNFETVKDFVVSVVDGFEIGLSRTRIGVVQYSNEVQNEFNLTEYDNKPDVQSAISNITYLQGRTYTGAALRYMADVSFSEEAGARPVYQAIPKVGIVVTDGEATDSVAGPARHAHDAGINVFAIGVGNYDLRELRQIATDPDSTHVFTVEDFAATDYIKDVLEGRTCKEPAPVEVGETVVGDLPQGSLQFLSFKVKIGRGMTFKLKMRVGSVSFFLSVKIRNPNGALYDFRLRTRPNKMRLDIFIPPSRLRELLGRERRQAEDETVELFAALEGNDETNQFDLETSDGDTADPDYLDSGSARAAVGALTVLALLIVTGVL